MVRRGELIALLLTSAFVKARQDPTLAIRSLASNNTSGLADGSSLTRRVVMVTTQDQLQIPLLSTFGSSCAKISHYKFISSDQLVKSVNQKVFKRRAIAIKRTGTPSLLMVCFFETVIHCLKQKLMPDHRNAQNPDDCEE